MKPTQDFYVKDIFSKYDFLLIIMQAFQYVYI